MNKPPATPIGTSKVKKRRKKPRKFNIKNLLKSQKICDSGLVEEAQLRARECCRTNPNFAIICDFLQKEWRCIFKSWANAVALGLQNMSELKIYFFSESFLCAYVNNTLTTLLNVLNINKIVYLPVRDFVMR